jgi:DMSO/TMAO reductase YedYZ molybdopterin-dependent catalytic subunit
MGDQPIKLSRRQVLHIAALGLGSSVVAACQRALEPISKNAPILNAATSPVATPNTPPPQSPTAIPITSTTDFFSVSIGATPSVQPNWKLTITGFVDNQLALSLADIKSMPAETEMRSLMCISNPVGGDLTGNAIWKGVRLRNLLTQAGLKTNARFLKLESLDQFATSIPLELGTDKDALLVYEMNGEPLPVEYGAPLRCLCPGRYGMKQAKWLQTISVLETEFAGFWEKQGWSNKALIKPFALSGIAFSDDSGLQRLDVSWDETKQWFSAELNRGPSPLTWTLWRWSGVALSPGRHTLYARATDNRGNQQTFGQSAILFGGSFPNGEEQMQSIILDFKL